MKPYTKEKPRNHLESGARTGFARFCMRKMFRRWKRANKKEARSFLKQEVQKIKQEVSDD